MTRLSRITDSLFGAGTKTLVPFFTAGYPDLPSCQQLVAAAAEAGCQIIEIGIPFSDPVADGPVIQAASSCALSNGITLPDVLELAKFAISEHDVDIVLMGYTNPILHYGPQKFARACGQAGVAGVIVPDLVLEESAGLRSLLAQHDVTLVDLVAPTTNNSRLERYQKVAAGFLYLAAVAGVTGTAGPGADLEDYVDRVRKHTNLPLYVGFGISTPADVARVAACADGVIVGSAIIRLIEQADTTEQALQAVNSFLTSVNQALAKKDTSQ